MGLVVTTVLTVLTEISVVGACPSDGSPERWGAMCVVQPFFSSGRCWELRILSCLYDTVPVVEFLVCASSFLCCFDVRIFSFA